MCFETSSNSSFTVFSSLLCVLLSFFSFACSPAEENDPCSPPEENAEYLQRTHSSLSSKGSSCTLPSRYKLCATAAFLQLLTMFWCEVVSYLKYVLVWHYLLGHQNNLDAFCSSLCLQNTYCFLLCFLPQGKRHATQLLWSNSRKNIKNFSSGQAREINKPQGIYHTYPSWTYGSKPL